MTIYSSQSRGRVLIVEDDRVALSLIAELLGEHFDVTAVSSIGAARAALRQTSFDVVVSDYALQDGRGLTLLEYIYENLSGTVGILLTAHADHPDVHKAQANWQLCRLILKPYDPEKLIGAVKQAATIASLRKKLQRRAESNTA